MTSEGGDGSKLPTAEGGRKSAPATLTGQHRAFDEAAAELVAAWDVDIDSRTPAEGKEALERLRPPDSVSSFPPAPNTPTLPAMPSRPPARSSGRTWALLGGAAALLGLGALAMLSSSTEPATSAAGGTVEEHVAPTTAPAAAPTPAPAPVVEPIPAEFSLTVRTIPKDAVLTIDGQRVRNPYQGKHGRQATLRIEANAPGHEQGVREIELDEDTHLMVTLVPEEPPRAAAQPAPKAKARRAKAKRRKARQRRAQKQRRRATQRKEKSSAAGFVSSNPYQ